jgi:hypothetical protein
MTAPRPPSESELRQAEAATWGTKPTAPASESLSRAEIIAGLEREIALRKRVCPIWVKDGRLTQEKADRQIALLEAAIIALKEQSRAQQPRVTAANWKPIGKGTLAGTADAIVGRWVIKECCYHRQGEKRWVNWPVKEWVGADGQRHFVDVVGFTDPDLSRQLRAAVLDAIRVLAAEQAAGKCLTTAELHLLQLTAPTPFGLILDAIKCGVRIATYDGTGSISDVAPEDLVEGAHGWLLLIGDVDDEGRGVGPDGFNLAGLARLAADATAIAVYANGGDAGCYARPVAPAIAGDGVVAAETTAKYCRAWRCMLAVIAPYTRLLDVECLP